MSELPDLRTQTRDAPAHSGSGEIVSAAATASPTVGAELAALRCVDAAEYVVQRQLASGGMGRIFEAWDSRHERRVAMKMPLAGAGTHARFVREMRITGRLQHPGIVPLYESGRLPTGEPFFAMKLVDGEPLSAVIARTRARDERLALLPHLLAVTEALAYAHEQRFIHRDLKPSNVLVGSFGETVVIDWGLAKHLDEADDDDGGGRPPCTDGSLTADGRALGTPSYMSPEQARGEPLDRRADVYALGALLYHALSGTPPYRAPTAGETLGQVRQGPPPALRERAAGLPADLLAIVEKAMSRRVDERYPSATEMAADLRRLVRGQLVRAHSYSARDLVRRWIARHRASVVVAATMLVLLVAVGVASVVRITRERDRADALKVLAERRRSVAVGQRDAAERVVVFVIGTLRGRLEPLGKLDLLEGVGREVESYYASLDGLDTGETADARAIAARAAALQTLGEVEARKLNQEHALELFRASRSLADRALLLDPENVDARSVLVTDWLRIGTIERALGRLDDALRDYQAGAVEARTLTTARPDLANAQVLAAKLSSGLGYVASARGDLAGANAAYHDEVGALRALVSREPDDRWRHRLAWALLDVAMIEDDVGHLDASLAAAREGLAICQTLVASDGDNTDWLNALGWLEVYVGEVEMKLGHLPDALATLRAARRTRVALAARDTENSDWRRDVMTSAYYLCLAEAGAGERDAALGTCLAGHTIAEAILRQRPHDATARTDRVFMDIALGHARRARGEWREAHASFTAGVATSEGATPEQKADSQWLHQHVECERWLARASLELGRASEARLWYDRASELAEPKLRERPVDAALRAHVAAIRTLGGDLAAAGRDVATARVRYEAALALLDDIARRSPKDADNQVELRETRRKLAAVGTP